MNETITGEPAVSSSITGIAFLQANNINSELAVIYDPADPKKSIIEEDRETNNVAIYFIMLIGLLCIGISIASFLGYITF